MSRLSVSLASRPPGGLAMWETHAPARGSAALAAGQRMAAQAATVTQTHRRTRHGSSDTGHTRMRGSSPWPQMRTKRPHDLKMHFAEKMFCTSLSPEHAPCQVHSSRLCTFVAELQRDASTVPVNCAECPNRGSCSLPSPLLQKQGAGKNSSARSTGQRLRTSPCKQHPAALCG